MVELYYRQEKAEIHHEHHRAREPQVKQYLQPKLKAARLNCSLVLWHHGEKVNQCNGSQLWNTLPQHLCECTNITLFTAQLQTYLFTLYYSWTYNALLSVTCFLMFSVLFLSFFYFNCYFAFSVLLLWLLVDFVSCCTVTIVVLYSTYCHVK